MDTTRVKGIHAPSNLQFCAATMYTQTVCAFSRPQGHFTPVQSVRKQSVRNIHHAPMCYRARIIRMITRHATQRHCMCRGRGLPHRHASAATTLQHIEYSELPVVRPVVTPLNPLTRICRRCHNIPRRAVASRPRGRIGELYVMVPAPVHHLYHVVQHVGGWDTLQIACPPAIANTPHGVHYLLASQCMVAAKEAWDYVSHER